MEEGTSIGEPDRKQLADAFAELRGTVAQLTAPAASAPAPPPAAEPAASSTVATGGGTTIRIEQEKLDRLMRVVGELLVARGALPVLVQKLSTGHDSHVVAKELKEAGAGISRIADELQDCVMAVRMLPVKTVFQKFPRLIRDLARSLGKQVRFVTEGESIELDKTILEQIGDPLVHLIRNAIDHGIETPEARARQGKGKDPTGLRYVLRTKPGGCHPGH